MKVFRRDNSHLYMLKKIPSVEKFRRMICFSYMSSGACPYRDHCVFLHDPRLESEYFAPLILNGTAGKRPMGLRTMVKDTFYWPDQPRSQVEHHLEADTGIPRCNQCYLIPDEFSAARTGLLLLDQLNPIHDRAIYSIWNHFVDAIDKLHTKSGFSSLAYQPDYRQNKFVPHMRRLPVFFELSRCCEEDVEDDVVPFIVHSPVCLTDDEDEGSFCDEAHEKTPFKDQKIYEDLEFISGSTACAVLEPDWFDPLFLSVPTMRPTHKGTCKASHALRECIV